MQIYQERRRLKRFLYSKAIIYTLLLFAVFLFVSSIRMGYAAYKASESRKVAEMEYKKLESQKQRLDKKIGYLENGEALEKEAKERFNVTSPGENVLIILERTSSGLDLEANTESFWQSFKKLFKFGE